MLTINHQAIKENAAAVRLQIQLDSLEAVKGIVESQDFSNDEKIHLIQSQFIVENAELKQIDEDIENLDSIGAFFMQHPGHPEARCAACDGSCEQEAAPEGQMSIFDFLVPQAGGFMNPPVNPFANIPGPSEPPNAPNGLANQVPSDLSKELVAAIGAMQELANTVLSAIEK